MLISREDVIELRSDTFSLPSEEMYRALMVAPLGDDVYRGDPTVNSLEARAAELAGKDAALFVTSGTQGNLLALLSQCGRGDEVIVGAQSDILNHESSGMTAVAGVMPRPVDDSDGAPSPESILSAIRKSDVHNGTTTLLLLENSHQRSGGTPIDPRITAELTHVAHGHGLRVHLDGARLFNAAVACGVEAREMTQSVDTVTFCLSKGLSCPAGSLLCGDDETIERARKFRKMLGGGMRQAGWLAAAGLVALREVRRLAVDHDNARVLAQMLAAFPGIDIDDTSVRTNIVYFSVNERSRVSASELLGALWEYRVRAMQMDEKTVRMVTHRTIERKDVETAARLVGRICAGQVRSTRRVAPSGYTK